MLDEAYERLAAYGPEYGGGLSNHAPMVAEALAWLGRPQAIHPWLDGYVRALEPAPPTSGGLALGKAASYGAWVAHYARALAERPWSDVVDEAMHVLRPGLPTAAAHGWLRTAHAIRALRERDTAPRRAELARGLAYWSSVWTRLPADPAPRGTLTLGEAVARLPPHVTPGVFLISDALAALADAPAFPAAVDAVSAAQLTPVALVDAVADLVLRTEGRPIVYAHAITAPAALFHLDPADEAGLAHSTRWAWQTVAALVACYPGQPSPWSNEIEPDALVDLAIGTGDEHAIKVTAAAVCARSHGCSPTVLAAAHRIVSRLGA